MCVNLAGGCVTSPHAEKHQQDQGAYAQNSKGNMEQGLTLRMPRWCEQGQPVETGIATTSVNRDSTANVDRDSIAHVDSGIAHPSSQGCQRSLRNTEVLPLV